MNTVYRIVYEYCQSHQLFDNRRYILVACSGGADSTYLLYILTQMLGASRLLCVYFDHGLRQGAVCESEHVHEISDQLGVPCMTYQLEVSTAAKLNGISLEMAGRQLRLQAFRDLQVQHHTS